MLSFSLLAVAQVPEIISYEPVPATPWTHTFKATCYGETLEIIQSMRPKGVPVIIRMNGRRVKGDVGALQRELGIVGAAYRFAFLCSNPHYSRKGISMRWHRGLFDGYGKVAYRVGSAQFRDGRLVDQNAEDADERSFWYR